MLDRYALVLLRDLDNQGSSLGEYSIQRLARGLEYHRQTGARLVVAATFSPNRQLFPKQTTSMADMAAEWLLEQGYEDTVVLQADSFDTRGELSKYFLFVQSHAPWQQKFPVISAPFHLERVRNLVRLEYSKELSDALESVVVEGEVLSGLAFVKEWLKAKIYIYLPRSLQTFGVRTLQRLGLNTSY